MSVHNGAEYLRDSIDSVLNQTYDKFEFLIIDDGSTDSSRKIIESYDDDRIKLLVNETNIGLIKSLNKGISESSGEYIARQDADDICYPERFAREIEILDRNPDILLVGTQLTLIDNAGVTVGVWSYPVQSDLVRWFLLFNSAVAHSSSMYRKKNVQGVGGTRKQRSMRKTMISGRGYHAKVRS
jgi:glycosyltransferase involved in cell wall biosynthesis